MRRVIAVTGTPGTGKTTFSNMLCKKINAELIDLKSIVDGGKIPSDWDGERETRAVDVDVLRTFVASILKKTDNDAVIDGLLSPFLDVTHIIVLRTDPIILKKRLEKRGYSRKKMKENIEAEALGVCLHDSLWCRNVIELDTSSDLEVEKAVVWLESGGKVLLNPDWFPQLEKALKDL